MGAAVRNKSEARITVTLDGFSFENIPSDSLFQAIKEAGDASDFPSLGSWADCVSCALRRRGFDVRLVLLANI